MILILFGPPGAGKGTQGQRLSRRFGLSHLASGDILRAERASGTELGGRVAESMDAGQLVPDDIIIEVVLARLLATDGGCLLDGFPRTVAQAESLDVALERAGRKIDAVVELQVPDAAIVERMAGRRICPTCNRVYHTETNPPVEAGRCDHDGVALVRRPDDDAEVVRERLRAYHAVSEPLSAYYRQRKVLQAVDGTGTVDRVAEVVSGAVDRVALKKEGDG